MSNCKSFVRINSREGQADHALYGIITTFVHTCSIGWAHMIAQPVSSGSSGNANLLCPGNGHWHGDGVSSF